MLSRGSRDLDRSRDPHHLGPVTSEMTYEKPRIVRRISWNCGVNTRRYYSKEDLPSYFLGTPF